MIFLVEYDRPRGVLVRLHPFEDNQREAAEQLRLQRELEVAQRGLRHEVVLLQAADEDAIRRTHRRYFMTASQIVASSSS